MQYQLFHSALRLQYRGRSNHHNQTEEEMKTIEEASKEYATEVDKNIEELYGIVQPTSLTFGECAADAFRAGVNYLMSLPLCDRLKSEEREQIQTMYKTSKDIVRMESDTSLMYSMHIQIMCVLECIFGTAMFDEKGGEQ